MNDNKEALKKFFDQSLYATIVHYKTQINGHWGFKTECYVYDNEMRAVEHGQDAIFDHKLYFSEEQLKFAFEFLAETKRYDFASAFVEVVRVSNIDQSKLRSTS
jgi:hypothetical protein|tara:strand:- start:741 stop:1052 length:312 start_codon:yes stop_codon:yes gene_type:complete